MNSERVLLWSHGAMEPGVWVVLSYRKENCISLSCEPARQRILQDRTTYDDLKPCYTFYLSGPLTSGLSIISRSEL